MKTINIYSLLAVNIIFVILDILDIFDRKRVKIITIIKLTGPFLTAFALFGFTVSYNQILR